MSERINGVAGLSRFRAEWDERTSREGLVLENATSAQGHINVEGKARCASSFIFTPADPEFLGAIEAGVRPLVLFLIQKLGCITYSSCEGHPPGDGYTMRGRHVGILTRDAKEHQRLLPLLRTAAQVDPRIEVREDVIAGDGGDVPCLDIVFMAESEDWDAYVRDVDTTQERFLEALKSSGASPGAETPHRPR